MKIVATASSGDNSSKGFSDEMMMPGGDGMPGGGNRSGGGGMSGGFGGGMPGGGF